MPLDFTSLIIAISAIVLFWGVVKRLLSTTENVLHKGLNVAELAVSNVEVRYRAESAMELAELSDKLGTSNVATADSITDLINSRLTATNTTTTKA